MKNYSKKRALTTLALVVYLLGLPALKLLGTPMPWIVALAPMLMPVLLIAISAAVLGILYTFILILEVVNDEFPDSKEN